MDFGGNKPGPYPAGPPKFTPHLAGDYRGNNDAQACPPGSVSGNMGPPPFVKSTGPFAGSPFTAAPMKFGPQGPVSAEAPKAGISATGGGGNPSAFNPPKYGFPAAGGKMGLPAFNSAAFSMPEQPKANPPEGPVPSPLPNTPPMKFGPPPNKFGPPAGAEASKMWTPKIGPTGGISGNVEPPKMPALGGGVPPSSSGPLGIPKFGQTGGLIEPPKMAPAFNPPPKFTIPKFGPSPNPSGNAVSPSGNSDQVAPVLNAPENIPKYGALPAAPAGGEKPKVSPPVFTPFGKAKFGPEAVPASGEVIRPVAPLGEIPKFEKSGPVEMPKAQPLNLGPSPASTMPEFGYPQGAPSNTQPAQEPQDPRARPYGIPAASDTNPAVPKPNPSAMSPSTGIPKFGSPSAGVGAMPSAPVANSGIPKFGPSFNIPKFGLPANPPPESPSTGVSAAPVANPGIPKFGANIPKFGSPANSSQELPSTGAMPAAPPVANPGIPKFGANIPKFVSPANSSQELPGTGAMSATPLVANPAMATPPVANPGIPKFNANIPKFGSPANSSQELPSTGAMPAAPPVANPGIPKYGAAAGVEALANPTGPKYSPATGVPSVGIPKFGVPTNPPPFSMASSGIPKYDLSPSPPPSNTKEFAGIPQYGPPPVYSAEPSAPKGYPPGGVPKFGAVPPPSTPPVYAPKVVQPGEQQFAGAAGSSQQFAASGGVPFEPPKWGSGAAPFTGQKPGLVPGPAKYGPPPGAKFGPSPAMPQEQPKTGPFPGALPPQMGVPNPVYHPAVMPGPPKMGSTGVVPSFNPAADPKQPAPQAPPPKPLSKQCAFCKQLKSENQFYTDTKCSMHDLLVCYKCIHDSGKKECPSCKRLYSENEQVYLPVFISSLESLE